MGRYRTRKDWYGYHLSKHQYQERQAVESQHADELAVVKDVERKTRSEFERAKSKEPLVSRFQAFFGINSDYRIQTLLPLEQDHYLARRALSDAWERHRRRLQEADKRGAEKYKKLHQARRDEMEARAVRVARRKREQHLRYLETSPAIRSAARPLKQHLINEQSQDGENVRCYYCHQIIPIGDSHLEHKQPVARGGTNKRSNLVLACATCNLRKGRKTHDEYLRYLQKD